MIKAVIFDLNGIFIQSPKLSERFEKDFGIPTSLFLPKLSEIMDKARKPNASDTFQYWKPILREWNISLTEQEFWDYWFKAETVSQPMISFAKELKEKNIKVFVLSNNFKERARYYSHYPWMNEVINKVYFSWQTGLIKPDLQAWIRVLTENDLKADECLYFDDQDKNLKAATSVGIRSFLFNGEEDLIKTVKANISFS